MCKFMIEWTNQSNNTDRNNEYGKEKGLCIGDPDAQH